MTRDWKKTESAIESVIDALSGTPGGSYVDTLSAHLLRCKASKSFDDKGFQESARALYQLLTHPRGVSDVFVEGFTLGEWLSFLFAAASSLDPFIKKPK